MIKLLKDSDKRQYSRFIIRIPKRSSCQTHSKSWFAATIHVPIIAFCRGLKTAVVREPELPTFSRGCSCRECVLLAQRYAFADCNAHDRPPNGVRKHCRPTINRLLGSGQPVSSEKLASRYASDVDQSTFLPARPARACDRCSRGGFGTTRHVQKPGYLVRA